MAECILCVQQCDYVGIAQCNHQPFCFRCIYKMRVISKNNYCPICKSQSKFIIIAKQFKPFQDFKKSLIADTQFSDIFYESAEAKKQFEKLTQYKCSFKGGKACKNQKKFPSIAFLKKHLKEDHHRYLCDVCLDRKTCVLEEQKLYTFQTLNKHLERGDIDESGNITFMHPFCKFCNKHFFDQDEFRKHINVEHFNCNVCGSHYKYYYYKSYESLDVHYKISHYVCTDSSCLAKKFIAFKTAQQLRVHRLQYHEKSNLKKVELKQLCGFQAEGRRADEQYIQLKDNEGVDMQEQYLSLKKTKNRALGQADEQIDEALDIRDFMQCNLDDAQHMQSAFVLKHHHNKQQQGQAEQIKVQQKKKKKYVQKQKIEKQRPAIAKQNQVFSLQDIKIKRTMHSQKISYQQFEKNLRRLLKDSQLEQFNDYRNKMNKYKITPAEFLKKFLETMKFVSLKAAYEIIPHYVRCIQNEDLKLSLDKQYLLLLKKLPYKTPSLLTTSQNYSDFFKKLCKEIEANIQARIRNQTLSIKFPVTRGKQRLYQMMSVIRRLKIGQMAKLKFSSNFGIQTDTIQFLIEKVFKKNIQNTQQRLSKINNDELLDLYLYSRYSHQAITHSKEMQLQKNKIHENILEDFLYERPDLELKFGRKESELKTLQQKIEFEKHQEEKRIKKQLKDIEEDNKRRGFKVSTNFNLKDTGDFPQLVQGSSKQVEEQQKHSDLKQVIRDNKQKPATYQKKMNELFPTLGNEAVQKQSNNESFTAISPKIQEEKKEKPWWQKINEPKKKLEQQPEVITVTKKGKKKKQTWTKVTGLFN